MSTPGSTDLGFVFDNTYQRLPAHFFARLDPTKVSAPALIKLNEPLARLLGLDPARLATSAGISVLAGNTVPDGASPIAMAYAGHQFGGFAPQLGDGRAILLGEIVGQDGIRRDIQLKGAGPTPFSRRGDGRAALGPVLREYIVSEAMTALGIPSTRALAAVMTGDHVFRESAQPGAILTRVAQSHVRVGTFQYFAARGDVEALRQLADYVIARLYPDLAGHDRPYLALIDTVVARQASLISAWLLVGFIHGVMNTDNMSIAGETIDFGPCAFMDAFHPDTVYSSIDQNGRYAYGNQPAMAQWNLARFAETLLPLIDDNEQDAITAASAAIDRFAVHFVKAYGDGIRRKLGLLTPDKDDITFANDLLGPMANARADFTNTFHLLGEALASDAAEQEFRSRFAPEHDIASWLGRWRARLTRDGGTEAERRSTMMAANPAYIPRNHLVQEAITSAVEYGNFDAFNQLVEILQRPYEVQPGCERFRLPPRPEEMVYETFCGT